MVVHVAITSLVVTMAVFFAFPSSLIDPRPIIELPMEPLKIPWVPQCSNGSIFGGFHSWDPLGER